MSDRGRSIGHPATHRWAGERYAGKRMVSRRIASNATKPVAHYIGGKRKLAPLIIERISKIPHQLYAEAFVGMGGIFLRRDRAAPAEAINDRSRDVANLFRILQRHYVAFLEMLKWQLTTRADFERLIATNAETLTDLERAARFLYLQRTCYGGKVDGRNFGMGRATFNITRLAPLLEEVHERLAGVVIECLPFGDFIARYDRAGALFYLDPPYWGCEGDYGAGLFSRDDFAELARILAGIKGRFLLSLNDVREVRRLFGAFKLEPVKTSYTVSGGAGVAARELLITGP